MICNWDSLKIVCRPPLVWIADKWLWFCYVFVSHRFCHTNGICEQTDLQTAGSFLTLSKTGAPSVGILGSLQRDTVKHQGFLHIAWATNWNRWETPIDRTIYSYICLQRLPRYCHLEIFLVLAPLRQFLSGLNHLNKEIVIYKCTRNDQKETPCFHASHFFQSWV